MGNNMTDILKKLIKGRRRSLVLSKLSRVLPICIAAATALGFGAHTYNSLSEAPETASYAIADARASLNNSDEITLTPERQEGIYCGNDARVSVTFANGAKLTITGGKAGAMSSHRHLAGEDADESVCEFLIDTAVIRTFVDKFAYGFNNSLQSESFRIYDDRIELTVGAGQVSLCKNELFDLTYEGLRESFLQGQPIVIEFELPQVSADVVMLEQLRRSIYNQPISAIFDAENGGITQSETGVDFDVDEAAATLNGAKTGSRVSIMLIKTAPEVSSEFLEGIIFRDLFGETITHVAGTEHRLNNVVLSSAAVDGLILMPGEEFSFNQTVGRRTWERGYRPAPAIVGGRTVDVVGGGICQVSSSIYNAIMDSEIQIEERRPHSRPVPYLPVGRDATVSWGTIDFRFANNTQFPLRIDADVNERTLTVRVFGTIIS